MVIIGRRWLSLVVIAAFMKDALARYYSTVPAASMMGDWMIGILCVS